METPCKQFDCISGKQSLQAQIFQIVRQLFKVHCTRLYFKDQAEEMVANELDNILLAVLAVPYGSPIGKFKWQNTNDSVSSFNRSRN